MDCCGEHRGLGVQVSFIRSLVLDTWSPQQGAVMLRGGNEKCNTFLKHHGIKRTSPVAEKYGSMAASLYREKMKREPRSPSASPTTRSRPSTAERSPFALTPRRRSRRCSGIELAPVLALRRAVMPLRKIVPGVRELAAAALAFAANKLLLEVDAHGLTEDEVAAINLLTLNSPFRHTLDAMMRANDNEDVAPFFPYLRLVLSALMKLPDHTGSVFCVMEGGRGDSEHDYEVGTEFYWPHVARGHTALLHAAEGMLSGGASRRSRSRSPPTLFCVEGGTARDVRAYSSLYANEEIIVLLPGAQFSVQSHVAMAHVAPAGLTLITVRELSANAVPLFRLATPEPLLSPQSLSEVDDILGASWPPRHRQIRLDSATGLSSHVEETGEVYNGCSEGSLKDALRKIRLSGFGAGAGSPGASPRT